MSVPNSDAVEDMLISEAAPDMQLGVAMPTRALPTSGTTHIARHRRGWLGTTSPPSPTIDGHTFTAH